MASGAPILAEGGSEFPTEGPGRGRLLQKAVDALPAMVAYWNTDLRNLVANKACIEWFGCSPDELPGMHMRDALGEETFQLNLPNINAVLSGHEQTFERTLTSKAGENRHVQLSYVPDIEDSEVIGFFVLVTDITEKVESGLALERAVEQYRALARSIPNAVVLLFDEHLEFSLADGPLIDLFSVDKSDRDASPVHDALPALSDELEGRYEGVLRGETHTWDCKVGERIVMFSAGPVRDRSGEVFAGFVMGTDVTAERQRAATDEALRQITMATAEGCSPSKVLDLVADSMLDLFSAANGKIARVADGDVEFREVLPPTTEGGDAEVPAETASDRPALGRPSRKSIEAAAPLHINGRMWGAIGLGYGQDGVPVAPEVQKRLTEFADAVASSISSAEAWQALAAEATVDPLTNLPNRRIFYERLPRTLHAASLDDQALSVVMIDIDHFKTINDSHGHLTGDRVLAAIAARMSRLTRGGDTLARIGGEEFAILLPGAEAHHAVATAERIRAGIASAPIEGIKVTISAGVCSNRFADATAESILSFADEALYEAKRAGRNTVKVHRRLSEPPSSPPDARV